MPSWVLTSPSLPRKQSSPFRSSFGSMGLEPMFANSVKNRKEAILNSSLGRLKKNEQNFKNVLKIKFPKVSKIYHCSLAKCKTWGKGAKYYHISSSFLKFWGSSISLKTSMTILVKEKQKATLPHVHSCLLVLKITKSPSFLKYVKYWSILLVHVKFSPNSRAMPICLIFQKGYRFSYPQNFHVSSA